MERQREAPVQQAGSGKAAAGCRSLGVLLLLIDNIPVSLYHLLMKTTIDFPEHILHRAKTIAVQRKITLKELVLQGLEHAIRQPVTDVEAERKARAAALIAALSVGKNTEPIGRLNRDAIPFIPRISTTARITAASGW